MIEQLLGPQHAMITGSKGRYSHNNPENLAVFNAKVQIDGKEVWKGDLDVTLKLEQIKRLAHFQGNVSVFYESSSEPVLNVNPNGKLTYNSKYYHMKDGTLKVKQVEKEPYDKHESIPIPLNPDEVYAQAQLPPIEEFKPKSGEEEEFPYLKLAKLFEGLVDFQETQGTIFVSQNVYPKLSKYSFNWLMKAYPRLRGDSYGRNKEFGFLNLMYSPASTDEEWVQDDQVYYRADHTARRAAKAVK